ncbi:primosomal replication protein PriC [Gilliamella sp. GillExp13]|uniref:primosomal replication protein PriC n=1 Tax=Gilliamella sp. GillExp13 TaxID=3120243 RepID=UPI0009BFA9A7|nr:primosomal replication protein PriC [Gilliamella apicola]
MANLLTILRKQIDKLEQQINLANDQQFQEPYFDEQLFQTNKIVTDKTFYLEKIKQTYQVLVANIKLEKVEQITFLSDKLVNQIAALTRELATQNLRPKGFQNIIAETLAQKHMRHLDYLRRLQDMKYELELSPEIINQSKIAALDNRIYRCEQAIKKIEFEIENDID